MVCRVALLKAACVVLALSACRAVNAPPVPLGSSVRAGGALTEMPDGNFMLHVVNESRRTPEVDIRVCIDGKTAVNHRFSVGNGHNVHTFVFDLPPGRHTLRAHSSNGQAHLDGEFTLGGERRWACLQYWHPGRSLSADSGGERCFTLEVEDRPRMFL